MKTKKKLFFYVLGFLTLVVETILIILFLKGNISVNSFILIGISNLCTMIISILNIKKIDNKVS